MRTGPEARLTIRNVRRRFGPTLALDGVSLSVDAGEVHALLGANGAGKSTLLRILSGAVRADSGEIQLNGKRLAAANPAAAGRAGIAMIHQEGNLAPHLTVEANIMLGMESSRFGVLRSKKNRERTEAAFAMLGDQGIATDMPAGRLGPGQRQLVEIARVLAADAQVVIMDEPTSSLNPADVEHLFAAIERVRAGGASILYVSHFLDEVQRIADRWTALRDGQVAGSGLVAGSTIDELVTAMHGDHVSATDSTAPDPATPNSTRVDPAYDRQPSLQLADVVVAGREPISLDVMPGEIVGLTGLMGSGRTRLLRSIVGLEPRRGRVEVRGVEVPRRSPRAAWEHGIGFLSEDRAGEGIAGALSLVDNVCLGRRGFLTRRNAAVGRLETLARPVALRYANMFQPARTLSGGNQQKIAFMRLRDRGSTILILDEPTRGVDIASREAIEDQLRRLAAQGAAILLAASQPEEVLRLCHRIGVMHRGSLCVMRERNAWTLASLSRVVVTGDPSLADDHPVGSVSGSETENETNINGTVA